MQEQTSELAEGEMQTPAYRVDRALVHALLPAGDPLLRETTPKTVGSVKYEDLAGYYAKTYRPDLTTIVVIGDITPDEARGLIEKCFGSWHASGPKPEVVLPPVPANKPRPLMSPTLAASRMKCNYRRNWK